jgi:hypothetical protein
MRSSFLWLWFLICAAVFASWALMPLSWEIQSPGNPTVTTTIARTKAFVSDTMFYGVVFAAGSLIVIAVWPKSQTSAVQRILAMILAVFGFLCGGLISFLNNLGPWTAHGQVQDAQGNHYVFCDSSFLQGQTMSLTRLKGETAFTTYYNVLGSNNGDSPRSFLTIVRPSNFTERYGQLYLADEQWLLGVRYDNHCYLAYDLVNQKFYGHGDIEKLSPFLAIEATQQLNAADVAKITKLLKEASAYRDGRPTKECIEQGLQHPNPEVRKLAAEWLAL